MNKIMYKTERSMDIHRHRQTDRKDGQHIKLHKKNISKINLCIRTLHFSLIASMTLALSTKSLAGNGTIPESGTAGTTSFCGRPGATAIG